MRAPPMTAILTLLLSAAAPACGGDDPAGPGGPGGGSVPVITLSAAATTLTFLGETVQIEANVTGLAAGADGTVTWSVTDGSVFRVDDAGVVSATGNGSALVRASVLSETETLELTVAQALDSVAIVGPDTVFAVGVRSRFTASGFDAGGAPFTRTALEWASSAPAVATVDASGMVTPVGEGTADISVTVDGMGASRAYTVVDAIPLELSAASAEAFQWALEDTSSANGVVGVQAAIIIPGQGTWQGVYGQNDSSSVMRPDLLLPVGSVAKTVISGLVLDLVDDGLLELDDSVGTWVSFANVPGDVTVRQLLQNTSGVASFTSGVGFGDSIVADLSRLWTLEELMQFVGPVEFQAGTSWKSSNTGYLLGGIIAETVTGSTVPDLFTARLFDPLALRMAQPAWQTPPGELAVTWSFQNGQIVNFTDLFVGPAFHSSGGPLDVVMDAESLARWGAALFGDFLSPAVRAEMLTDVPDDGGIPGQVAAGVGIRKYNYLGRTSWGHSGNQGNGSAFLLWDETTGITIALTYNLNGAGHGASHFRLIQVLLGLALQAM
ncbi:MAG: serine hydrolase [Gemmatimonadota bacterium]